MAVNSDDLPEDLKARYSNFQLLGSGGMGRVYKAFDSSLLIDVAIKILPEHHEVAAYAVRFQQEARTASKLKHKNIVTILDFGITRSEQPYLVMEYVEGRTLASILATETSLTLAQTIHIMMQICDGMKHAHSSRVVHRDLKPENIMVLDDDYLTAPIKILDFGIAKIQSTSGSNPALTQGILGTRPIMSPEQISSKPVDLRSDIYSCGCLLFRMLSGRYPFEGDSALEIMQSKIKKEAPRLNTKVFHEPFPLAVEELVSRCLQIDPDDRYDSMSDLKDALVDASEVLEPTISDPDVPPVVRQFSFKKVGLIGIAAFALILLSLSVFPRQPEEPLARKPLDLDPVPVAVPDRKTEGVETERVKDFFELSDDDKVWIARNTVNDDVLALLVGKPVRELKLEDQAGVTDRGCAHIAKLTELEYLSITDCPIGDEGLRQLGKIKRLHKLSVEGCRVTDAGVAGLVKSPVEDLNLSRTDITDLCLPNIAKMKRLDRLIISANRVTDAGLKTISAMPLECIHLESTGITDGGMKYLPGPSTMERLYIDYTQVSERGLRTIAKYPLKELYLVGCPRVDDKCVAFISANWPGLKQLSLNETSVTAAGIKHLETLQDLEELRIAALGLDDEGIAPVMKLRNLRSLTMRANLISDLTLERLAKMPKIHKVDFTHCDRTTEIGKVKLAKTLPDLRIGDPARGLAVPGAIEGFDQLLEKQ